jgi:hypothetical protein
VEYKPNSIWIYDTTHFTRAKMAVLIIQDLVSRIFRTRFGAIDFGEAGRIVVAGQAFTSR